MKRVFIAALLAAILAAPSARAHSPICDCYDNGDDTVTCEGGFSDGSSAAGVSVTVKDASGNVLLVGVMTQDSEFTFDKPRGGYTVVFDAGDGHRIEIDGGNIVE